MAYLLRGIVALGPDDLHFLAVLALKAFNFVRNALIEEVGIGRIGMYFVVIRSQSLCLCDPMKVLV